MSKATQELLRQHWIVVDGGQPAAPPVSWHDQELARIDAQIAALNAELDATRTPIVNPAPGWTGYAYPNTNTDVEDYADQIRRECSADRGKLLNGG